MFAKGVSQPLGRRVVVVTLVSLWNRLKTLVSPISREPQQEEEEVDEIQIE